METDTGWGRSAGESTGRWRTILARASGRASVPTATDSADPSDGSQVPGAQPDGYDAPHGAGYDPGRYDGHHVPGQPANDHPTAQPGYSPGYAAPGPSTYPSQYSAAQHGESEYSSAYPQNHAAPGYENGGGYGTYVPPAAAPPPAVPVTPVAHPTSPAPPPAPEGAIPAQRPGIGTIEWRTPVEPAGPELTGEPLYAAPREAVYTAPREPLYAAPREPAPAILPPTAPPPAAPLAAGPPAAGLEHAYATLRGQIEGSKVIAFANPKGGVHKTTATVLAAATIGSVRGRGVVAWDDNELRGTLGLRAGSARHARTIRHLVTELAEVELHTGPDLAQRLDDFLRHASDGSYDVLAGEEDSRFAWKLDPQTVRRVLDLLTRTHQIICVDTGNNVESANWQTVMQSADQLVITTVPREDSAFTADWMMDILIEGGLHELVENAVTLLSLPTPRPSPMVQDLVRHFKTRTRGVAVVPYDPALEPGASIEYSALTPDTRQAWYEAAALIMAPHLR